ncbi:MAG: hypothetical protein C3F13_01795 [Anaerolineales bacterium]|nr:glycosyl hydrolase family protein [Anaerolineae bacterium]PWB56296.1 MAG: hypothetical protein C3F13_01795 [Anaerolineales bacterium]
MAKQPPNLHTSLSPTAQVSELGVNHWHLQIPADAGYGYRLAQLDDHAGLRRKNFVWKPPLSLQLQARVSNQHLPGTWGFGFWNDPFSFLIAYGGRLSRFPTLPQAAWFFHASPHNYLSFRDDLPASGFLAATFRSINLPAILLALAAPAIGFTIIPQAARYIRRLIRRMVSQDAAALEIDVTQWHSYGIKWETELLIFTVDDKPVMQTQVLPQPPLSLVIWIDNQYAALPPVGRLKFGTLPNPEPTWMEIRDIQVFGDE